MNQKECAAALGIKASSLRAWMAEPGFPRPGRGQYDLAAILRWRDERGRKGADEAETSRRLTLAEKAEKVKEKKLRNVRLERQNAVDAGELLVRGDVETFASTLLAKLGDLCEQLPDLVANDLPKKYRAKAAKRLKQELDAWRQDTADELARAGA